MNKIKIEKILKSWEIAIELGRIEAYDKIEKLPEGTRGRLKRTSGVIVVFGIQYYRNMAKLRKQLCIELPNYASTIRSDPDLMNGYAWTSGDFVELSFSYYQMVIDKIRQTLFDSQ